MADVSLMPVAGDPFASPSLQPVAGDPWNGSAVAVDDFGRSTGDSSGQVGTATDHRMLNALGASAADIGRGIWSGVTYPRDFLDGKLDPLSDEGIGRALGSASLLGGGMLAPEEGAAEQSMLASRSASLYNPPSKALRPFDADYPSGAPVDASGNLTHDIEGRPLVARFVAGRTSSGGPDQAIAPAQFDALSEGAIGSLPTPAARSKVPGGGVGAFVSGRGVDGPTREIYFDKALPPQAQNLVIGHELGHAIDDLASQIPTSGLLDELKTVYNDQNNPQSYGKPFTPQNNGYKGADIPPEYMAEAIRSYMADPNYLKTVAPKTAAAIRGAVNSNPRLNGMIQFNAGGLPIPGSALATPSLPQHFETLMPGYVPAT